MNAKIMVKFALLIVIFSFFNFGLTFELSKGEVDIKKNDLKINCENTGVLEYFPIDLDYLFFADNLTAQQEHLEYLKENGQGWFISPWGGHFISGHIEGNDKWYLTPFRCAEVHAPNIGKITRIDINELEIKTVNDYQVVVNTDTYIEIDTFKMRLANVDLLKSIYDEFESEGTYHFYANETVGFTSQLEDNPYAMEFFFWGNGILCPYFVFSEELKTEFDYYWDLQYQAMVEGGIFPESKIYNPVDISIENSVWGVWQYSSSNLDSFITDENLENSKLSIITLLNKSYIDTETFYRDPRNTSNPIPSDINGLFTDCFGAEISLPEYNATGLGFIRLIQGNQQNGILTIEPYYTSEWGESVPLIYARFSVNGDNEGSSDDILTIEYFATLSEASSRFTNNNLTYIRHSFSTQNSGFNFGVTILIFCTIALSVFIKKRKK